MFNMTIHALTPSLTESTTAEASCKTIRFILDHETQHSACLLNIFATLLLEAEYHQDDRRIFLQEIVRISDVIFLQHESYLSQRPTNGDLQNFTGSKKRSRAETEQCPSHTLAHAHIHTHRCISTFAEPLNWLFLPLLPEREPDPGLEPELGLEPVLPLLLYSHSSCKGWKIYSSLFQTEAESKLLEYL